MNTPPTLLLEQIRKSIAARGDLFSAPYHQALRLYNGYYEGCPGLTLDLFAGTLLISLSSPIEFPLASFQEQTLQQLPWITTIILKDRSSKDPEKRRGVLVFGASPATQISENDCWYALDLMMNQDASFYLDTRYLRAWLTQHAAGWQVVNTFAYTGSLGIAALAGGAERVLQIDLNKNFLSLAQRSCNLNHFNGARMELLGIDFFNAVSQLKRSAQLFDCVIVDPPFFSTTRHGKVNLVNEGVRVINKVRPLVKDGGYLVTINNALFLSGADYLSSINGLCDQGYLKIEEYIDVPVDFYGYPQTIQMFPPVSPAPFNHSTKIVVLKVRRKAV
jgi:23S rRNA (cytosine1962-C5)-methyltransferase